MTLHGPGPPVAYQLLEQMMAAARQAGDAIMAVYGEDDPGIISKADNTPVTRADLNAHHIIATTLSAIHPVLPLLSEEAELPPYDERRRWRRYWLVDPLDGTREFIRRSGEFTVNIALVEDGVAVLGVVYGPASRILYAGCRVGADPSQWQAWKMDAGSLAAQIHARRIDQHSSAAAMKVLGSRDHGLERVTPLMGRLAQLWPRVEVQPMGSSLKMCLIAQGLADLYLRYGPTGEWDTAAAQVIVEAAGGGLFQLDGTPLRYNRRESLVNPAFYCVGNPHIDWPLLLADL